MRELYSLHIINMDLIMGEMLAMVTSTSLLSMNRSIKRHTFPHGQWIILSNCHPFWKETLLLSYFKGIYLAL